MALAPQWGHLASPCVSRPPQWLQRTSVLLCASAVWVTSARAASARFVRSRLLRLLDLARLLGLDLGQQGVEPGVLKRSLVWRPAARLRPKGRRFRSRLYGRPGDRLGDLGGSPVTGRRFRVCARGSCSGGSPVLNRFFGPPRFRPRREVREFGPCPEGSPEGDNGCRLQARRQIHSDANYQNGGPPQALTLRACSPVAASLKARRIARVMSGPGGAVAYEARANGRPATAKRAVDAQRIGAPGDEGERARAQSGPAYRPRSSGSSPLPAVRGAAARPRCRPRTGFASPSRSRRTPIQRRGR